MSKGREKGARYERRIARKLSLWASEGKSGVWYSRRPFSGGAQRHKEGATGQAGDIYADMAEAYWFTNNFAVECKFYTQMPVLLWRYFSDGQGLLNSFIQQASEAANTISAYWMLIMKGNHRNDIVFTDYEQIKHLIVNCYTLSYNNSNGKSNNIVIFDLEQLFKVQPDKLKHLLEAKEK